MQELEKLNFQVGNTEVVAQIREQRPLPPFADETLEFLQSWSDAIRNQKSGRRYPDVASFAFWCRRNGMLQQKKEYEGQLENRLGRGVSLQFAPSNIPVLFAFSMTAALLAGCSVLVRLPGELSEQTEAVLAALRQAVEAKESWKNRIAIFQYAHDKSVTDALSALCDVRVIWGGDRSVQEIRRSPLRPRATDIPFAERHSLAVLRAQSILETDDLHAWMRGFYNDTYLNDQNACSAPNVVYWLGTPDEVSAAQEKFWSALSDLIAGQYQVQPVLAVKKWETALRFAGTYGDCQIQRDTNRLVRVLTPRFLPETWEYAVPGGFFLEGQGEDLHPILPLLTEVCQTISCCGISEGEIIDFLVENRVTGVDRVVPVGHTLDFSLVWDGNDLIMSMSRKIVDGASLR